MRKIILISISFFIFKIGLTQINNETKFDIKSYIRNKEGLTNYEDKIYYEILSDPYTQNLIGYNVLGGSVYHSGGHDAASYSPIEDPHFIDATGKVIAQGKLLLKRYNSNKDTVSIFYIPKLTFDHEFGEQYGIPKFFVEIGELFFYKKTISDSSLQELFTVKNFNKFKDNNSEDVNSSDDNDFKIKSVELLDEIEVLKKEKSSTVNNVYFLVETNNGNKSIIDKKGNILFKNDGLNSISLIKQLNGFDYFLVTKKKENTLFGIAKSDGSYLYEPTFEEIDISKQHFRGYGICEDFILIIYEGKYGFLNSNLEMYIEPKYSEIQTISNSSNLLIVKKINTKQREYNKSWYPFYYTFLNPKTKNEQGIKFDELNLYNGKEFAVKINGYWGFCDNNGILIVQPKYSFITKFSEGMAFVETGAPHLQYRNSNEAPIVGFIINRSGIVLAKLSSTISSDILQISSFSDGYILYKSHKTNKFGYINAKGEIALQPEFETAEDFVGGKASIKKFGTTYFINKQGIRIN